MDHNTGLDEVLEFLKTDNATPLVSALQVLMNAAMLFERQKALGANPYGENQLGRIRTTRWKETIVNSNAGA